MKWKLIYKSYFLLIILGVDVLNAEVNLLQLDCDTVTTERCRKEFTELFARGFKSNLIAYLENTLRSLIDFYAVLLELRLPSDSLVVEKFIQSEYTKFRDISNNLQYWENDHGKLHTVFRALIRQKSGKLPERFVCNATDNHLNEKTPIDEFSRFFENISELWRSLFWAMRSEDLKELPELIWHNSYMKQLPFLPPNSRFLRLRQVFEFLRLDDWHDFCKACEE